MPLPIRLICAAVLQKQMIVLAVVTALAASRVPKNATQVQAHLWRAMQVFFPAEASEQPMPRWFFDRSPSEVKAAFLTRRKKTELDQVCIHVYAGGCAL